MSDRSLFWVIYEQEVVQKRIEHLFHAWFPSALLQARYLPLEQRANDALASLIQFHAVSWEPSESGDCAGRLEELACSDIGDAVEERAELLERRRAIKQEGWWRFARELEK